MKNDALRRKHRLSPEKLYARLDPDSIPFETTASLAPYRGMIGQDRAMRAVELGLRVRTRGFNIFAVGDPGSGKTSTLERLLEERASREPVAEELCYVYNFEAPDRPMPLMLPAGKGRELARDMERMVTELERMVPRVLSEGSFGHIRAGIVADTRRKAHDLTRRASQAAEKLGLQIEEGEDSLRVAPVVDGQPIDQAAFEQLPPARRRRIEVSMTSFQEHLEAFSYGRRQLEREHGARLLEAEVRAVTPVVEDLIGEISGRYRRYDGGLAEYLEQVKGHILESHRQFMPVEEGHGEAPAAEPSEPLEDPRVLYHINVVVDRSGAKGAPVVVERVPTPSNLCGCFEYRETQGGLVTDHSLVRPGSLHQANGGYLLIQASDLLSNELAWDCLKRALRHKEIRVEEGAGLDLGRPRVAGSMKPGTVPLRVKVILVGTSETYYFLKIEDEDFGRLFKIKADFETTMPRTRENVQKLGRFLGQVCREEGYLPLHKSGVARIVEVSSRRAEHQGRMCTRRAETLDVLAEANFFAREAGARSIRGSHVEAALDENRHRHGRIEEAVDQEIREGSIIIRTRGLAVGQLNGIALYDLAGTTFGVPVRITARTYVGKRGVVNIDREVNLSGAIHDKGALILVGYLGGRYAQEQTLALSASITFEQSYDEIDGDSASSAELYALLSSLSGCPIRQGIAVTGSVNQLGEVQPIGGVNEKIESIYRVCKNRGLTGEEGVMIPASNVRNLMLDREVVDAVREGKFSIYAVESIDEGIEVLTGVKSGALRRDGTWEPGSINAKVAARLAELAEIVRVKGVVTAMDREI